MSQEEEYELKEMIELLEKRILLSKEANDLIADALRELLRYKKSKRKFLTP